MQDGFLTVSIIDATNNRPIQNAVVKYIQCLMVAKAHQLYTKT